MIRLLMRTYIVASLVNIILGALGRPLLVSSVVSLTLARLSTAIVLFLTLEPLLPSQVTPVFEHVARFGVQSPEGTFARLIRRTRNFDETVVERKAVTNRILPSLLVLPI